MFVCTKCNIVGRQPTSFVRSTTLFAEGNLVLCPQADNDVILRIKDVASKLANDVVSLRTQTQKEKASQMTCFSFWRLL